jgi:hypothetical protein
MLTATSRPWRAPIVLIALVVSVLLLGSCGGGGGSSAPPPPVVVPLAITTTSLTNAQISKDYTTTLAAKGGTAPYKWSLTSGALPPGLSLDAASGMISGTPVGGANSATLIFQVTDSAASAATSKATLTLTVLGPPLAITTNALPQGVEGVAYSATLTAAGGVAPYTWTLTSGTLPAELALDAASGNISGIPLDSIAATPLTFKVTVSASPAVTVSATLPLTVTLPIVISTTSLPDGQVGVP